MHAGRAGCGVVRAGPEARTDPELFTAALLTAARAYYADLAAALRFGEQAVELARQLGAEPLLIDSLFALSGYYYLAGEPERGFSPGQEAVESARQFGDDVLLGASLMEYLKCDFYIDGPLFTEAIAATQRSGDHLCACMLAENAGINALIAGDIPAARAHLEQAARAMQAATAPEQTTQP